jgi:predicted ATPase
VLIAFFKEKKALLVFDNFEHVIKAAPIIDELHKACTALSILVSSRIILQLRGEKEYQVPPFNVPKLNRANTLDELRRTPSVALFTQRAQASRRNFSLTPENSKTVAEICVRLDGLPLGIELAAARTKIFSPESLLKRLNTSFDVLKGGGQFPPRHQTIRHTIAWSYDLLEMEEQLLFRCMSFFVGGCTLEAIEELCGGNELFHGDIVEGVMALVDKSLLSTDDSADELRFYMLETINEFAREELGKSKEQASIKKGYINYFLKLSEEASPHFYSSEAEVWNNIISPELPNIRAAIDHAIESGDMALAYRFVKSLIPFWSSRGLTGDEGVQQLEKVTAVPVPESLDVERLKLRQSLASFYLYTPSRYKSEEIFEECLAFWRKQDDENQLGLILNDIGWYHIVLGSFQKGEIYTEEARVIFERLSNKKRLVASLNSLGMLKMWQRKPLIALSFFEQTFVLTEELKDQRRNAQSVLNTAYCNYLMGNYKLAEGQIEQALVTFRKNSSLIFEETALIWLCYIYYEYGAYDKCKELCIRIREIGEEANIMFGKGSAYTCMALAEFGLGNRDVTRDLIRKAEKLLAGGEKHFMYITATSQASIEWDFGDMEMVKSCCQTLLSHEIERGSYLGFIPGIEIAARIAAHEGNYKSAAILFFNAQVMRAELSTPIRKSEAKTYQDLLKDLKSNLSPKDYALAMEDPKDANQLLSLANDFI